MEKKYEFISILAGGACPNNCSFCIGKGEGQQGKPQFAKYIRVIEFLEDNIDNTDTLSISGHTSDPLFTDFETLYDIITYAKRLRYKVSLHTHNQDQRKLRILEPYLDELCISLNTYEEYVNFNRNISFPLEKLRVASVVTEGNKEMFKDINLYNLVPAPKYTLRKNVFEPRLVLPKIPGIKMKRLFGNTRRCLGFSEIVILDCPTTNSNIETANLWSDGISRPQEYWGELYGKKE